MNGWKYKILLLLCSAMLVVGCSREEVQSDSIADGNTLIRAKISTRTATDANALGAAETVIRRVRIYAFDDSKLDKMIYKEFSPGAAGEALVEMEVTQTNTKMLYVIINEPLTEAMRGRLSSINHPEGLRDVEYTMADYFNNMAGTVFNSSTNFDNAAFCLPMYGETTHPISTVGNYPQSTPLDVPLTAIRSLARVDIYMQKEAILSTVDLIIDARSTISFFSTRERGYLTSRALYPSGNLTDGAVTTGPVTPLYIPEKTIDYYSAIRTYTLYTPERSCATSEERISFALNMIDFGGPRMNFAPVIIGNEAGKELTTINRNKVYQIYCTFQPKTIKIDLSVQDWDDQAIVGDIAGSELFVSQSKVVMDWFNLGQKFDTSVAYVSDGNVSFVGYVVKNANDTDKSISTDGSNLPAWLPKEKITNLPNGSTKTGRIGLEYVVALPILTTRHLDVVLRIKTGNITKDIRVVYDNGFLPNSLLATIGWADRQPGIGLHLTKRGNVLPASPALANDPLHMWSPKLDFLDIEETKVGYGVANTDKIIASVAGDGSAAAFCRVLGAEWYLSSFDELTTLSRARSYIGPSYFYHDPNIDKHCRYWSSSAYGGVNALSVLLSINSPGDFNKNDGQQVLVRCVRNM